MAAIVSHATFWPPPPSPLLSRHLYKLAVENYGHVDMYYAPSPDAADPIGILLSHGNACDVSQQIEFADSLREHLWADVLVYDYPGYGNDQSDQTPSEDGAYAAIDAAYDYMALVKKIPTKRIIVMGHSMGCGPTMHLASTRPVGGMLLMSPFLSAVSVVSSKLARTLGVLMDIFNNREKVQKVACPTSVIHGLEDTVIPVDHGETLAREFSKLGTLHTQWFPEVCGHGDIYQLYPNEFRDLLRGLMQKVKEQEYAEHPRVPKGVLESTAGLFFSSYAYASDSE